MLTNNANFISPESSAVSVLQRIANREPGAFDDFMQQYRPLLAFLVRKSMGSRPRARSEFDDAMQEISVAIWQAAPRFDPARGTEKTFISMVARRRLIDRFYRQPGAIVTREFATDTIEECGDVRDEPEVCSALLERAERALAALEPENRHLFELAVIHGKSSTEIARATGLRINTVKTRIHRTLNRVRSSVAIERVAA